MKFYTDTSGIPEKYVIPLAKRENSYITLTDDVHAASHVILPVRWEIPFDYSDREYTAAGLDPGDRKLLIRETQRLLELSESAGKPPVIIYVRDKEGAIPVNNAVVFRTSLSGGRRAPGDFAMPVWTDDIGAIVADETSSYRTKQDRPSVGFMGKAEPLKPGIRDSVKKTLNRITAGCGIGKPLPLTWDAPERLRTRVIRRLLTCEGIHTDIHISKGFFYGRRKDRSYGRDRAAFIHNIIGNDYTLCVRGGGNYSFRLYETMSAGRIPLFINTDCVLPFDFLVNWKKYFVWVDEKEMDNTGNILLEFHNSLPSDEFVNLQHEIRKLWVEWLSPEGFFRNFHKHFAGNDR